jgi:signal transduction histidine kinase
MIMKSTNHFSIEYGNPLPLFKGNFQRLEQVMINLVQNACQALPDNRKAIFVSTSYDEKKHGIVVNVEDEGTGIPSEILSHITEPFYTTKAHSGGLGLGLSISLKIVKEHGGTLTFTSESGKGTKAEIVLPTCQVSRTTMESNE